MAYLDINTRTTDQLIPPCWREGRCWHGLEHLDLSLEVRVGHVGHHHHVLGQGGLGLLGPVAARGLQGAGLLEPPVPHLDLVELITGVGSNVGTVGGRGQAHGVVRQLGHEPRVLHDGGVGVGTELLDIGVSKAALV